MTMHFSKPMFWDNRYRTQEYIYGAHPNDFLREHIAFFKVSGTVLSLAEGEGRNAVFIAQQGCRVCGVDFSAEGRSKALQLARNRGIEIDYEIADLTRYDMGEARWDGIVSIFCHLSEDSRPALYDSIRRGLKPGGVFLLESYNKRQLDFRTGGPGEASHLLSLEEIRGFFDDYEIVIAHDTIREVHEGQGHGGTGSVTQFIVRKPGS